MAVIRIQETGREAEGGAFLADVTFDSADIYPVRVSDPFTPEQECNLEWYFEKHLHYPFADRVRAREAGKSVYVYGAALFDQLFGDRNAYAACRFLLSSTMSTTLAISNLALLWRASGDGHVIGETAGANGAGADDGGPGESTA